MKLEWDGDKTLLSSYEGAAPFRSLWMVFSDPERAWWGELTVLEDSVLGVLLSLVQRLHERFPWWGTQWTPMFILMGKAPVVGLPFENYYQPYVTYSDPELARRQSRIYQPITIEVAPWTSVEHVSQVYKRVKEHIPTTPLPSERRLALFAFVMKHPEVRVPGEGQEPETPPWGALMSSWNESLPDKPEWRYKDRRNFRRDFLEAFDQIVNYYR
jgi:hypothetical protein